MGGQRRFSRWLTGLSLFRTLGEEVIPAAPRGWLPPLSGPLIGRSSCYAPSSRRVIGQRAPLLEGLAALPPPYADSGEAPPAPASCWLFLLLAAAYWPAAPSVAVRRGRGGSGVARRGDPAVAAPPPGPAMRAALA